MSTETNYFLRVLHIAAWIIFVGLCIEAGGSIMSTIITLFFNPGYAATYYNQLNLGALYKHDQSKFVTLTSIMIIVSILKAILFFVIVRASYKRKLVLSQPFNDNVRNFIIITAYLALGIGLFAVWGSKIVEGLVTGGISIPRIEQLKIAGGDVWLFTAVILMIIAEVFKKGIALQTENDLTV